MDTVYFNTRRNVMELTSLQSFAKIKGGCNKNCKDIYFIRCIGHHETYLEDIAVIDELLATREFSEQGKYMRMNKLPKLVENEDILLYATMYEEYLKKDINFTFKITNNNRYENDALLRALKRIETLFEQYGSNITDSIKKNFLVKMMYWMEWYLQSLDHQWDGKITHKVVYYGELKMHEYLFMYLLSLIGIDVMLLAPQGELSVHKELLILSECLKFEMTGNISIPEYQMNRYMKKNEFNGQTKQQSTITVEYNIKNVKNNFKSPTNIELEFEELAQLASSVVMIGVHDKNGDAFATGSGIMISNEGYILTNNHVASGGAFYSVRIEDDEEIYRTDELIKYNSVLDLALIRIHRKCKPIAIYHGEKTLARGQKVVAIGSPLGLFNSVSDGIISGFREIDDVKMIQFTAPTSHGSSGGAVLNMYGEVIGISTAGIDRGQNINLAVDYAYIQDFVRGFI